MTIILPLEWKIHLEKKHVLYNWFWTLKKHCFSSDLEFLALIPYFSLRRLGEIWDDHRKFLTQGYLTEFVTSWCTWLRFHNSWQTVQTLLPAVWTSVNGATVQRAHRWLPTCHHWACLAAIKGHHIIGFGISHWLVVCDLGLTQKIPFLGHTEQFHIIIRIEAELEIPQWILRLTLHKMMIYWS